MTTPLKLAVLVSGTGSNLQAMIDQGVRVALVVGDRPCRALDWVAKETSIPYKLIPRRNFIFDGCFSRKGFTQVLGYELSGQNIELVAMAGFMSILHESIFTGRYAGRILNTHPSLLPLYKGAHAVADALKAGVSYTGATVHYATATLDAGPIIEQVRVPIKPGDTETTLHERIKAAEHELYPKTILRIMHAGSA